MQLIRRMSNMFEKIRKRIADQLSIGEDEIRMDSSFADDLGADSLDIVELIMALEEEFDMEIPDEDAEKISTVGDVVEYIKARVED
jgi:acyl carrier protein